MTHVFSNRCNSYFIPFFTDSQSVIQFNSEIPTFHVSFSRYNHPRSSIKTPHKSQRPAVTLNSTFSAMPTQQFHSGSSGGWNNSYLDFRGSQPAGLSRGVLDTTDPGVDRHIQSKSQKEGRITNSDYLTLCKFA